MKGDVKRHPVTVALLILLLSGTFGCATHNSSLASKEQVAPSVTEQASPAEQQAGIVLKDQSDKISYTVGLDIGKDVMQQKLKGGVEPLLQGVRDALLGNKPLLADDELVEVRKAFVVEKTAARAKELGPQAEQNLKVGEAFLSENAKKEGVKTLPSGLQYRVIQEGAGATPGAEKNVRIHYVVRSINGEELDSTKGQPAVLPVRGVIPAWTEALLLMKEGAKWELFAPSYLAYGEAGVGKVIGPFQAVVFEIELLGIH